MNASPSSRRRRSDDVVGPQPPSHACADGDASCRLQKRAAIVSRLFFTMKIPTPACVGGDDLLRAMRRNGCAGSRRANRQSTRPDHQCPARGRSPQRCMDAYKVRTRRDSGTAARWFLIRLLERVLINAGIGRMSALGVNRTRRDGGNDVNDPERTLAILSRSRRFIFRCFRDHAYFVSIGAGPRRSWSAAEKATSIAESYRAGETGLWCRAASRSNVAAAVRLAAAGQADRSVCAGHIHPGGGAGGCVTA